MHAAAGYVKPDEIIADVTSMVDDENTKALSDGYYMSQIQQALSELAMDTYFDQRTWTSPITSLDMQLPEGLFNIEQAFLFNGADCEVGPIQNLYRARGATRMGGRMFKEQRGRQGNFLGGVGSEFRNDPIMEDTLVCPQGITYFSTEGDRLMLSDACRTWGNVFIKYRGIGCKLGEAPIIPYQLREAVKNYVALQALRVRFARDPQRWNAVLQEMKRAHYGGNGNFDVGTWKNAQRRVQSLDIKTRNDYQKYLSTLGSPKE